MMWLKYVGPLLTELDLQGTSVTDASIPVLKVMTALKTLNLEKTQISDRGVRELQKALPNCKIKR